MIQSFSWNQTSHYDLIRSLNNDGTTIDAYQENTGDKVFYKGHWYSARAPAWRCSRCPSTTCSTSSTPTRGRANPRRSAATTR